MAQRWWVGGTDTWDATAGSKWALTSGGSGGQAVPTSSDDVFFNSASGAAAVTVSGTRLAQTLTCTGFTGSITGGTQIAVSGSATFSPTMTITTPLTLQATGTLTSGGLSLGCNITLAGGATTLGDSLVTSGIITLNGSSSSVTLDANNFNITFDSIVLNLTSNDAALSMGSGTWSMTGLNWLISGAHTLTITPSTSTIKLTNNSVTAKTFQGGGKTYNNFWNATQNTGTVTITGSNTFNDFKIDPGRTQVFTDSTTTTVSSFTAGDPGTQSTLSGSGSSGWTISKASGTVSPQHLTISHSTATGGATWKASVSFGNIDGGSNSGWSFAATGRQVYGVIIG